MSELTFEDGIAWSMMVLLLGEQREAYAMLKEEAFQRQSRQFWLHLSMDSANWLTSHHLEVDRWAERQKYRIAVNAVDVVGEIESKYYEARAECKFKFLDGFYSIRDLVHAFARLEDIALRAGNALQESNLMFANLDSANWRGTMTGRISGKEGP